MVIQIPKGATLSGLAQQYGTDLTSLLNVNPNITNPNLIIAGANLNIPEKTNITANKPPQSNTQAPQLNLPTISTTNPALKQLINTANTSLSDYISKGGVITPDIQDRINKINDFETQKISSVASARNSANNKNAIDLNSYLNSAYKSQEGQQIGLKDLLDELKTARTSYLESIKPPQAELDLETKLNTLRTERKLLPLELRQEGISAPGISGRQIEDERVRAIQEQNLLLELGLKQKAREFETTAKEKQIGFISDDIKLVNQIQERLDAKEKLLLEQARSLRNDSIDALSSITKSFTGLAWEDLDPQTQADLVNTAKQFGLPINMVMDSLKVAKQQQVFDNAIKLKSSQKTDGLTDYQLNNTFLQISNKYQADAIMNQAIKGNTASMLADQIINDPAKATNQLASLYLLVKNLDPDSAVREGELALANQTQSYWEKFKTDLTRVSEGQLISPEATKNLALATKQLISAWNSTAQRRQQQYISQANTAGVGKQFVNYVENSKMDFGITDNQSLSDEEAYQLYLKTKGIVTGVNIE